MSTECTYNNETYQHGENFTSECDICTCEYGEMTCRYAEERCGKVTVTCSVFCESKLTNGSGV